MVQWSWIDPRGKEEKQIYGSIMLGIQIPKGPMSTDPWDQMVKENRRKFISDATMYQTSYSCMGCPTIQDGDGNSWFATLVSSPSTIYWSFANANRLENNPTHRCVPETGFQRISDRINVFQDELVQLKDDKGWVLFYLRLLRYHKRESITGGDRLWIPHLFSFLLSKRDRGIPFWIKIQYLRLLFSCWSIFQFPRCPYMCMCSTAPITTCWSALCYTWSLRGAACGMRMDPEPSDSDIFRSHWMRPLKSNSRQSCNYPENTQVSTYLA